MASAWGGGWGMGRRARLEMVMERPTLKPIGSSSEGLDTPALVVDLDALEANIAAVHSHFESAGAGLRPNLHAHLCSAIGHLQIRAGGTVGGVAVSTLGEAEVFSQRGFDDILVANLAVTAPKIRRAAALAGRIKLVVGADDARVVDDMGRAAADAGSELGVAAVVRSPNGLMGASVEDAAELAARIEAASSLRFAGLLSMGDGSNLEPLLRAADACGGRGIQPPMVASGGSANYDSAATTGGVTEVIAGSYALAGRALCDARPELRPAARILATVMSSQDEGLVWLDAGQKATSIDTGLPSVEGVPGASVPRMSAEHGGMILEEDGSWEVDLGSKVWLSPHDSGNAVNVYDFIHAARGGLLEAVWEVDARGRYD